MYLSSIKFNKLKTMRGINISMLMFAILCHSEGIKNPIKGFSHDLSADNAEIIDNKLIFIENLNYDGLGPDVHFWVGKGVEPTINGTVIPDENGSIKKLRKYINQNVTLSIPDNVDIDSIDWLSLWCIADEENIGYVKFKDVFREITAVPLNRSFITIKHNVSSGELLMFNEKTILVPNFSFDGAVADANFLIGNGPQPSGSGTKIPYKGGPLQAQNGTNVTFQLPTGVSISSLDWITVWSDSEGDLGHVILKVQQDYVMLSPITYEDKNKTGPILIVDDRTFFVTNARLDDRYVGSRFWVGRSENDVHVLGEPLTKDDLGNDMYVRLTNDLTIHNISSLGLWHQTRKAQLGFTVVLNGLMDIQVADGHEEFTEDGSYIYRMQKCCPVGQVKTIHGCTVGGVDIVPANVYEGNMTIFNDEPLKNVMFSPYVYQPACENGMFLLDSNLDEYYLLTGGSLLIASEGESQFKDKYCVDAYQFEHNNSDEWRMTPFVCFPGEAKPEFVSKIYTACIYISSIFLIFTSLIFLVVKQARDNRGWNVVGYSISMALSFICLATAQVFYVTGDVCSFAGYAYQFLIISTFSYLCCITIETYHRITHYSTNHFKKRFIWYAAGSLITPILFVTISISVDHMLPAFFSKPKITHNVCWFNSDKKVIFYYIPIVIAILVSLVFAIMAATKFKITNKSKQISLAEKNAWMLVKGDLANVLRSCFILLGVMSFCWVAEMCSYAFESNNGFWIAADIIDALQGIFVFSIFILHEPVYSILKIKLKYSPCCTNSNKTSTAANGHEFSALHLEDEIMNDVTDIAVTNGDVVDGSDRLMNHEMSSFAPVDMSFRHFDSVESLNRSS